MITNREQGDEADKWHCIALKSVLTDDGFNCPLRILSRVFRGIKESNNGSFYCLGCLHSLLTDTALKRHKNFYVVIMIIAM